MRGDLDSVRMAIYLCRRDLAQAKKSVAIEASSSQKAKLTSLGKRLASLEEERLRLLKKAVCISRHQRPENPE